MRPCNWSLTVWRHFSMKSAPNIPTIYEIGEAGGVKHTLRVASVIGRQFSVEALEQVIAEK